MRYNIWIKKQLKIRGWEGEIEMFAGFNLTLNSTDYKEQGDQLFKEQKKK